MLAFFSAYRLRVVGVVCLQVIAGFADNLSIVGLLPVIQSLVSGNTSVGRVTRALTDLITSVGLPADIRSYLLLVSLAIIVKAITIYVTLRAANRLVLEVVVGIRLRLLKALVEVRWPLFANLKSGNIISLQVNEVERFRPGLTAALTLMTATVQAALYIAASFLVSPQLTLLALVLGAVKVSILRPIRRGTMRLGAIYSDNIRQMTISLLEGLQSIKPIRAMSADESLLTRLTDDVAQNQKSVNDLHRNSTWFSVADDFLTSATLVIVLLTCSMLLSVDLAQLAVIGLLMSRILVQVGNIQKGQQTINLTSSVVQSLHSTLEYYRNNAEKREGTRHVRLRREIKFEDVSLGYDGRTIVSDVNLSIPAGSFCAFNGVSGGGKTTLVDSVLGLVAPITGRVLVDGVNLAEADIVAWRRHIGYVPQELVLFNASVLMNITFNRDGITRDDVCRALKAAEALEFVEAMPQGLNTTVGERGTALSGGQRQRLALARALVHSPDLLILDEATAALDPATEAEICRTLRRLSGERTILAISHQSRVANIADFVVTITGGAARVSYAEPANANQI